MGNLYTTTRSTVLPGWETCTRLVERLSPPRRQRLKAKSKRPSSGTVTPTTRAENDAVRTIRYGLVTSSLSLGLAVSGLALLEPLRYAAVPTLVYMGIPPAQNAYDALRDEGRPSLALAETVALSLGLASGAYLISSLGFCAYYLGRTVHHHRQQARAGGLDAWQVSATARVQPSGLHANTSTTPLQDGDRFVVQSGEIVPAGGQIVEGSAWMKPYSDDHYAPEVHLGVGDSVGRQDIVLVGIIRVQLTETS